MRLFKNAPSRTAHLVDAGRVGCPVLGRDIDVEWCLGCPRLRYVTEKGGVDTVTCEPTNRLVESLGFAAI